MPGKTSYLRRVAGVVVFASVMAVLPFGAFAPENKIAYLVADGEHSGIFPVELSGEAVIVPDDRLDESAAADNAGNQNGIPDIPKQEMPPPKVPAEKESLPAVGGSSPTRHVVLSGETLSQIAVRYQLTVSTLAAINNISNPNLIRPGQTLLLAPRKQSHTVCNGDNLTAIALRYGVTVSSLTRQNSLTHPDRLQIGQVLEIPESKLENLASRAVSSSNMIWPVLGRISSYFGPRAGAMHTGLDVAAATGTSIAAVRAGRVETAGWVGGYGLTVLINHGDGLKTLYGHASKLLVKSGDRVVQGQVIARVGSTGNSTGPHVHFEVRVGDSFKDPLRYLPSR